MASLAGGGRLLLDLHVDVEDLRDQGDQLVDAVVVDAVLRRREEAVLAAETQDVPGIDQRPALDGPVQQVFDLAQQRGGLLQRGHGPGSRRSPAARTAVAHAGRVDPALGRRQPAADIAFHACGRDRHQPACRAAASA